MDSSPRRLPSRAFSLIELLVVVGIIVILVSISIAVGFRVSGTGKIKKTEETLKVLDQALASYISQSGGNPKPYVIDPRPTNAANQQYVQPVMDGVTTSGLINSIGFFLTQCKETPSVYANFNTLPSGTMKDFDIDGPGTQWENQPEMPTIFDAWNNPIRYVHPAFAGVRPDGGGQTFVNINTILTQPPTVNGVAKTWGITSVRRNGPPTDIPGDSDGGIPPGNKPYFYSCGPDGDPSTLEDNIYTVQPRTNLQ